MPIVAPDTALHQALNAYMLAKHRSKAAVAAEFGMSPMTIGRFLKSGRVIEANRKKLESGLTRFGGGTLENLKSSEFSSFVIDSDNVISLLEFLLAAARQHAKGGSGE